MGSRRSVNDHSFVALGAGRAKVRAQYREKTVVSH